MKKVIYFFIQLFLFASCGIKMHTTQLVDEWGNTYESNDTRSFQERDIYTDQSSDVWGLEKTDCKHFFRLDSNAFSGKSCLSLTWDKTGKCPWIGMGFGWNGYAAKDMSSIMQTASISFQVRSIKGNQFIPTLIFLLEDYSGVQTATLLKAKHLSRYPIDENWQQVTVPLKSFLAAAPPLSDFSNIKSLNIECQGAGAILIDQITIIGSDNKEINKQVFGITTTQVFPATIFHDELPSAWGLGNYLTRKINIDTILSYKGKASLHLDWETNLNPKANKQIGINWENWQAISLIDSMQNYALHFFMLNPKPNENLGLKIGFESYNGKTIMIPIEAKYINRNLNTKDWIEVTIPFTEFNFYETSFDVKRFKQLLLSFEDKGAVWLDEITINKVPLHE